MKRTPIFIFLAILSPLLAHAEPSINRGTQVGKAKERVASSSGQEYYSLLLDAHTAKDWKLLAKECLNVLRDYSGTPFSMEATYLLGVAYFEMGEYDMANDQFSEYLSRQSSPKHFEEAIRRKYEIAEKFRLGERKHLMGFKAMPKWSPAGGQALAIYEEVISALPHHDLSAHALYGKGIIHQKNEDFRAGIEAFQTLIRRFPKHPLAVESYIGIGEVYLAQSRSEYPDANLLDLAELNLRKFRKSFPREGQLVAAEATLNEMRNHFATTLFQTARFYERTKKWGAAKIYYEKIIECYPNSHSSQTAKLRLQRVANKLQ